MNPHSFHPSIIREYDMRGIYADTLCEDDAYAIGRCYASMVAQGAGASPSIAAGRDGRLSSPALHEALISGLTDSGARVQDIAVGPTPMLYFSVYHLNADAGIMLTGSHNPKQHNGTKFMLGRAPFYGEQIKQLAARAASGDVISAKGTHHNHDVRDAYVAHMIKSSTPQSGLKLAWDCGNGAAGECAERLSRALDGHSHHMLFTEIDGNFPNHHPDPSVEENLADLSALVQREGCAVGLAFDGDGDRLGAVDDKGRMISSDHLLMLFAADVLKAQAGAPIIADVKTSQMLFDLVAEKGGKPLMWMTGHSHIKTKMKAIGAAFAGEASGHLFFADRYQGYDDGLYAALRLIEITAQLDEPLSAVIDRLPRMHSTPELKIDVDETRKFAAIDAIRARLDRAGASYIAIDGVRMQTPDGWWLIRASNTTASIVARAESHSEAGLERLIGTLTEQLEASGLAYPA